MEDIIAKTYQDLIDKKELAGCSMIIRRDGKLLYKMNLGYADVENGVKADEKTIYRLFSMTKPIIGCGIMTLVEEGKLTLEDKLSKFYPAFNDLKVVKISDPNVLKEMEEKLGRKLTFDDVELVPATRELTIRDLMTHSSGLATGLVASNESLKTFTENDTTQERCEKYSRLASDFQPDTLALYSPIVGFDLLGGIIELASGKSLQEFLDEKFFIPLDMPDTKFYLSDEQKKRLCKIYKCEDGKFIDTTGTNEEVTLFATGKHCSGGAGLLSTISDCDNFVQMLSSEGEFDGKRILKAETVRLMQKNGTYKNLIPIPGGIWGLSMMIWDDPSKMRPSAPKGGYGWSGAAGTHFMIEPKTKTQVVFMMNRSNIGTGIFAPTSLIAEKFAFGDTLK